MLISNARIGVTSANSRGQNSRTYRAIRKDATWLGSMRIAPYFPTGA